MTETDFKEVKRSLNDQKHNTRTLDGRGRDDVVEDDVRGGCGEKKESCLRLDDGRWDGDGGERWHCTEGEQKTGEKIPVHPAKKPVQGFRWVGHV
jgi:hypothetical protein